MKKLLHERLREIKNSDCESLAAVAGVKCHAFCNRYACHKEIYKALADEIEKYYIPRPRFEDGEPVQFGDRFVNFRGEENSTISSLTYTKGNNDYVNINGWHKQNLNEPVYRCKPKILDSDGVPCKKGETVWKLADSTKWEIIDIHPTEPRITVRQLDTDKDVSGGWFLAEEYSHREPDSLEKLRDDIAEFSADGAYHGAIDAFLQRCEDRLTAIMERDA